ncbi:MAG: alpha/beta fold hydrolase [Actinobacteria bacterium]|uniref:Unannotated protein n=1 Tax=freshwater metagenome TaxID=449393 RepID=A0A6J6S8Z8_9ZZZZ|nr:alpha/beta fold hydrolase [Actinomycetota bacterium]
MDQVTDLLGEPWLCETIDLAPDDEGPVVATLVSHRSGGPTRRAVLYVHGFADYFFQVELAQWWLARGYDFYALDLRKCGRSLRPGQTPHHVGDLATYYEELDASWARVVERDGHDRVTVMAHSTGGLTTSLWAHDRQPTQLDGLVLNSPWVDLQGSALVRTVGTRAIQEIGRRQPMRVIPRKVNGLYVRSLHRDFEGEWDFDLELKPLQSYLVHAGWLRAVRNGHFRLHRGLDVGCPVLVLSSGATAWPDEMGPAVFEHDIVLEVPQIRRWATAIGRHVHYVAVPGAVHDVMLSRAEPRATAYAELGRWHDAYVS